MISLKMHFISLGALCMRGSRKFYQRWSNFFLVDEGREDPNTTTSESTFGQLAHAICFNRAPNEMFIEKIRTQNMDKQATVMFFYRPSMEIRDT